MTQLKEILVMDEITGDENEKIQNIPSVLKTMQQAEVRPIPKINPDDIATFVLTSGTTGKKNLNSQSYFFEFIFQENPN
jgi:long-subunit acyl-CoA synthetase (AMP-forming)